MLKDRRKEIIEYVKSQKEFLTKNKKALNIYEGNLLPYIDAILQKSLSPNYYNSIRDRIIPINILQRFIDKVSCTYSDGPVRTSASKNVKFQEFVDFYTKALCINQSAQIADAYSNLFKGYAWEPYIDKSGKPAMRELAFDSFLVMSDSMENPEEETVFIKLMGQYNENEDSLLLHVYTDDEFDSFFMNGQSNMGDLILNDGINSIGTIPFVYGKRQKNRLLPIVDSDMVKMAETIPVILSDAAGAQMYQCFSVLFTIDCNMDNLKLSPNSIWDIKSDQQSQKNPQVGVINPTADTQKVVEFVMNIFTMWLESKGVRIGSVGQANAQNQSSGIAKIIDELDVWEIRKKSQEWFEKDEKELWNQKLPKIHNYWIKTGMVLPATVPAMMPEIELDIDIEFEMPQPMKSRMEEITEVQAEVNLGTMTMEQAILKLHPKMEPAVIKNTLANKVIV